MRIGIFGKKIGMTQVFGENGYPIAVTVIDTKECYVTQVKTKATDGYNALQLGFGEKKIQNINKAITGHFKKAGIAAKANLEELRFADDADMSQYKAGQLLNTDMFQKGDVVDVIGTSKGLGFTGVVKRYGWHGADATHGASKYFRHGGSNGTNTFPGRVLKNKGAPGHTGNARTSMLGLKVVEVRGSENLIFVRGSVPGADGSTVLINATNRRPIPADRKLVNA